jgi:hypothetical protein
MAAETLCPECGFGPIKDGLEECPKCHHHFTENLLYKRVRRNAGHGSRKDADDLEATGTTLGAITSSVVAHPLPTSILLGATAIAWVLRCTGVLSDAPEALWPFGLAALEMGVAMILMAGAGPAKALAPFMGLAQLGAAYFAGGGALARVGYGGVGVALLAMTLGEPSDFRRWMGSGAGAATLFIGIYGVAVQVW